MRIYKSVTELIGGTPILEPTNYARKNKLKARLLVKLEYLNPTGSVKDRTAKYIIESAERVGILKAGSTIIEPTSGNTGIGLAAIAAAKNCKLIVTMPENMSKERQNLLKAYGAQVVLTPAAEGMRGAIKKAEELNEQIRGSFIAGQFENPANPKAHYETTGPEIWNDTDGKIDILVAGVGTGGTISGASKYLKRKNNDLEVVAVEPRSSAVLSHCKVGPHKIQGLGAGFVPKTLNLYSFDKVKTSTDEDAIATAKKFAATEGILCGISSGAALYVATELAKLKRNEGKTIVTILPDSADRYYSTELFIDEPTE
ncbi:cysteine synthase A [Anaerocaecibacter muris]|uniref:cysteine synthase A n=1 Tax=Anaerocaecibacter muris TaxID=2941513 RepID=UPI00203B83B5|nr:cysteine synthase A [Anaerocaecibacter muris]